MPKNPRSIYQSNASHILITGISDWETVKFDFKKGQQALQEKDHTGYYTYRAGQEWKEFDFKSGFEHLIKAGLSSMEGDWIYNAGKNWKKFDYQKALSALKQIGYDSNEHLHHHPPWLRWIREGGWPRGATETIEISKKMKASSEKMSKKPFGLKEEIGNPYLKMKTYEIFNAGISGVDPDFDFNLGLDALIRKRSLPQIYAAGTYWKDFDFVRGFNALLKYDKRGEYIFRAGKSWKKFDYEKGKAALEKLGEYGASPLMARRFLFQANSNWPKGVEEIKQQSQEIKQSAQKMPKKPFGLKESVIRSVKCPECGKRMWEISSAKGTKTGCTNPDCPEYHRPSDLVKEVRAAKLAFYGRKGK